MEILRMSQEEKDMHIVKRRLSLKTKSKLIDLPKIETNYHCRKKIAYLFQAIEKGTILNFEKILMHFNYHPFSRTLFL